LLCLERDCTGADPGCYSAKLDDPSFVVMIYASLVKGEGDDAYTLIWSRTAPATDPTKSNGHMLFGTGVGSGPEAALDRFLPLKVLAVGLCGS
jgi:hypothetical protein